MFNWFKDIIKWKEMKYPLSKEDMDQAYRDNKCPDCNKSIYDYMRLGPKGGISQNIKCSFCGSFFNYMGPFGLDRISWFDHHATIMKGRLSYSNTKVYTPFTPKIIASWNPVHFSGMDFGEVYHWCFDNCEGKWSVKAGKMNSGGELCNDDSTFFFEVPDEAVAFKLRWS